MNHTDHLDRIADIADISKDPLGGLKKPAATPPAAQAMRRNPWACIDDERRWPEHRSAVVVQSSPDFWARFMAFVEVNIGGDFPELAEDGALRESESERGGLTIAQDSPSNFLAAKRWVLDYSGDSNPFSWTEIEVFFCATAARECVLGYRLRTMGDPSRVADAWLAAWDALCQELPQPDRAALAPIAPLWHHAPSFLQMLSTWASSGEVRLDFPALENARMQISTMQSDLDYQVHVNADQLRQNEALLLEVKHLRTAAKDMGLQWTRADTPEGLEDPEIRQTWTDLSPLDQWAADNETRIVIMPRALNGAKKSDYESPDQIREALEYLAGPYRDSRMGLIEKAQSDKLLLDSGVKLAGSAGVSVAGSQGEAYFISWRGRRRFLDFHLSKGGGRLTRYCLRIYFFWCEETQRAIVGWLPSHLNNSLS